MNKNKLPRTGVFFNQNNQNVIKDIFWIVGVAVVYYLVAWLSLQLIFEPEGIAAIWPGSGIFLSALILSRKKLRPYIAVVLFLTDFLSEYNAGIPLKLSFIYTAALTVEALTATWIMTKLLGENINFSKRKQVFVYILLVVILNTAVIASIAAAGSYKLLDSSYWLSYKWWFISGAVGNLVTTPFILSWASEIKTIFKEKSLFYHAEFAGLIVVTTVVNFIFFKYFTRTDSLFYYLNFLTIPFFIWAAFRFGVKGVATVFVFLTLLIYFGVYGELILLSDPSESNLNTLIEIQFFLSIITILSYVMASVIAERKAAMGQLQASNARWRFALEGTNEGVWDWNASTNEVFFSERWKSMLGYKNHEIENTLAEWEKRVHPDDKEKVYIDLNAHLKGNTPYYENEHRVLCKDGNYKWILDRGKVISFNKDGSPLRIIGTHTDISHIKEAQLKIAESKKSMDLFFFQSLDGFFFMMLDEPIVWNDSIDKEKAIAYAFEHQKITKVNDAMLKQYHANESEFLGLTPNDFFKHDIAAGKNKWRNLFNAGKLQVETDERRLDGSTIFVEGDYICLYDEAGRITGHFGIQRDITERKKAEEELYQSKQILQRFSDSTDSVMYIADLNGKMMMVNKRFEEISKLPAHKLIGKSRELFLPEEIALQHRNNDLKVIQSNTSITLEEENMEEDGKHFYLTQKFPLHNKSGKIYAVGGISTDITEFKKVESAYKESKTRFESFMNNTSALTWMKDENLNYVFVNTAFEKQQGVLNKNLKGKDDFSVFDADTAHELRKNDQLILKENKRKVFEEKVTGIDGKQHISKVYKFPFKGVNGKKYIGGMAIDITEQKQQEKEIKKLSLAVHQNSSIIMITDFDGVIEYVNQAFSEVTGYSSAEVMGKNPKILSSGNKTKEEYQLLWETIKSGHVWKGEFLNRKKNGVLYYESASIFPLLNEQGNIINFVAVKEDITEKKKAENEIKQLNAELEQRVKERTKQLESVNKELQAFTYSVSHDLKAPLRGIDGYSKLLKDLYAQDLNEEAKQFIKSIRNGTKQMNQLIEDLLEYSRLERAAVKTELIQIKELCNLIRSQFDLEISAADILFEIEVPDVQIAAYSNGLSIALRNLVANAIKFSAKSDHPAVKIGLKEKQNSWLISVTDNGIGFDMKYKDRIFEIFERLNLPEEYEGTGIGLALVQKSMTKMGGKVWAESTPGNGAVFYLQIPKLNK